MAKNPMLLGGIDESDERSRVRQLLAGSPDEEDGAAVEVHEEAIVLAEVLVDLRAVGTPGQRASASTRIPPFARDRLRAHLLESSNIRIHTPNIMVYRQMTTFETTPNGSVRASVVVSDHHHHH